MSTFGAEIKSTKGLIWPPGIEFDTRALDDWHFCLKYYFTLMYQVIIGCVGLKEFVAFIGLKLKQKRRTNKVSIQCFCFQRSLFLVESC